MRELKFRAWDLQTKKMHTVENINFCRRKTVTVQYNPIKKIPLDSACLMQYIGAKDKNGVEIYDGDIIHFPYDWFGDSGKDFIVRWNESCCAFVRESISGSRMWGHASREILSMCEVVGNVYENPELVSNEADT